MKLEGILAIFGILLACWLVGLLIPKESFKEP